MQRQISGIFLSILFILFLLVLSDNTPDTAQMNDGQATQDCRNTVCGAAYKIERQTNGSCLCVLKTCSDLEGCPPPPSVREDCSSVEGCPGPPPETKGP